MAFFTFANFTVKLRITHCFLSFFCRLFAALEHIESSQNMDKDTIYGISILLTFIIGSWNFVQNWRAAKKTSFINTVTAQRVKWLEQMRQDVASFVGLTHNWAGIFTMKKKNIYVNQSQELLSALSHKFCP